MIDFKKFNAQDTTKGEYSNSTPRRSKGDLSDLCDGAVKHINGDFRLRSNDYGPYATFNVAEDPDHFFYSGKRITRVLQDIDAAGARDELPAQGVIFKAKVATFDDGHSVTFYDLEFV